MGEIINITKEKYMDTDINTLLIGFSNTKGESFVSEYPVPEEMPYMIMYSKVPGRKMPSWIEVINPQGMLETEDAYVPDIGTLKYNGETYTLLELIHLLADKKGIIYN